MILKSILPTFFVVLVREGRVEIDWHDHAKVKTIASYALHLDTPSTPVGRYMDWQITSALAVAIDEPKRRLATFEPTDYSRVDESGKTFLRSILRTLRFDGSIIKERWVEVAPYDWVDLCIGDDGYATIVEAIEDNEFLVYLKGTGFKSAAKELPKNYQEVRLHSKVQEEVNLTYAFQPVDPVENPICVDLGRSRSMMSVACLGEDTRIGSRFHMADSQFVGSWKGKKVVWKWGKLDPPLFTRSLKYPYVVGSYATQHYGTGSLTPQVLFPRKLYLYDIVQQKEWQVGDGWYIIPYGM